MTFIVSSNPRCPGPGWRKLEIGEIVSETDLRYSNTEWQCPMISGHPLSESDLVTWRPIDPVEGPQWRDLAPEEMLLSTDLYWSSGRKCWLPSAFTGLAAGNSPGLRYRRWVGEQVKPADMITEPITVKPGWWEMRDGYQIQVFEWKPDTPGTKNVFKWCGLTPFGDGDVIFWTDGGYCNFDFSAATQQISDSDLVKFLDVPDSVRIRTLNETLEMKQEAIQALEHDLAQRQKTIEAQASAIQSLQTNIEQKVLQISTARLSDLQQRYNDMVADRDEWREKAIEQERLVSFKIDTIKILQAQLSQMSQKQSPAETQAAMDGIAALRAENVKLSVEKESTTRLALTRQEENDKLQVRLDAMTNAFESQSETSRQLRDRLEKCLSANAELIASVDAMTRLRGNVNHPNLSLIVAKLAAPDNQQQQQIIISGLMIVSQLVRKNMDYGGSAFTSPILMPTVSPIVAMCCRASDKIARLANLLSGTRNQVESETVLDTIGDLAGYMTLLYSYCNTIQGGAELESLVAGGGGLSNCEQQEASES